MMHSPRNRLGTIPVGANGGCSGALDPIQALQKGREISRPHVDGDVASLMILQ